jgi:hypothetical protein
MTDVRVPIKTWLKGPTYLAWERRARAENTTVGVLLADFADRALKPRTRPKRGYVRVTDEMRDRIAELHSQGAALPAIAREVGCSLASVYNHLPKEQG